VGPNRRAVSSGTRGMTQRPLRVLRIGTHPVQYSSPMFRLYAKDPRLEIQVAYCSLQGAEAEFDRDFGVEVKWDVPLLEGYPWVEVPNRSWSPRLGSFFGLFNPGIWGLIRRGNFDAVVFYTGYAYATFWMGIAAAKLSGVPILFGTDATSLQPRDAKSWKLPIKRFLLPKIFRLADIVIIPSEAGRQFILSMGISDSRIVLTPFVVDNTWWSERASEVDRSAIRREWEVPEDALVVLFCAKLQPWKRPGDVLNAFAKANVGGAFLVFAGDGPMRASLEAAAKSLGIAERTRFLGFVNQTGLPSVYRSADLFVLPSEYDPCPAVVCEAMLCGCPVVLSDEIRGRFDIVDDGETGFIFPCGDVDALARILADTLGERTKLAELSHKAVKRMETWSPRENVETAVMAIERAVQLRQGNPDHQ
jgi:glycosyltransferase involved in cell wall biosynthesis